MYGALFTTPFVIILNFQVAVHWKQYKKRYTEYYVNGNPPDVAYFVIDASSILVLCKYNCHALGTCSECAHAFLIVTILKQKL